MRSQYAPPSNYGIPNPWGPRTHNWKGGSLNEGSLFHGPIYTRPVYSLPRVTNPLFGTPSPDGLGADDPIQSAIDQGERDAAAELVKLVSACALVFVLEHYALDMFFGKQR